MPNLDDRKRAIAQLQALGAHPPVVWDSVAVARFNELIKVLEKALGQHFGNFAIAPAELKQKVVRGRRFRDHSYPVGIPICDPQFALAQLCGLVAYIAGLEPMDRTNLHVDLRELSGRQRDLVAAAELEAESIFDQFRRDCDDLRANAIRMGVSRSDLDFAPGNTALEVAHQLDIEGRNAAASHLFRAATEQFWQHLSPDIDAFLQRLDPIFAWTCRKFQIEGALPAEVRRDIQARALRARANRVPDSAIRDGSRNLAHDTGAREVSCESAPIRPTAAGSSDETDVTTDWKPLFERLSPDDPNFKIARRFSIQAWRDSFGLVADGHAGKVSLSDFIRGCVRTFQQGAEAQLNLRDDTSIADQCRELDRFARAAIAQVTTSLEKESERLGGEDIASAISEFTTRVNEITARSKQRSLSAAIPPDPQRDSTPQEQPGPKKKRGRPSKIAAELKERALAMRDHSTWREIAMVLYSTSYPTPGQVKNASNILNHYQKSTSSSPNKS